jgi:hypothetical protein
MIGGTDVVIPACGSPAALDGCIRTIRRYWPCARFENAVTGEKYGAYGEIPIGRVSELLFYPSAAAEAAWDADSPHSPPNSMLYLILSADTITAVVDDPTAVEMRPIIESLRAVLRMDILNIYAVAA